MDDLEKLKSLFPRGSKSFYLANTKHLLSNEIKANPQLPNPNSEHYKATALGKAISRKEKVLGRVTVRFNLCRVRPLDPDNATGSVKDCVDGLCRCGLIRGDDPTQITLIVEQTKVGSYSKEQTDIEIIWPGDKT